MERERSLGKVYGDGKSAELWHAVLDELKSRGVRDVFFVVCDGLEGRLDSVDAACAAAIVHTFSST